MDYAKKNELYLTRYISFQKGFKKSLEIAILLLTSTGLLTWLDANKQVTTLTKWSIGLSIVLQLAQLLLDKVVANEEHIDDLRHLKKLWVEYFDKLEHIHFSIFHDNMTDKEAFDRYMATKPFRQNIEDLDSDIKIWGLFFITNKSNNLTKQYMSRYYGENEQ